MLAVEQRQTAPSVCLVAAEQPAGRGQGRPKGVPAGDRSEAEGLDADREPAATSRLGDQGPRFLVGAATPGRRLGL